MEIKVGEYYYRIGIGSKIDIVQVVNIKDIVVKAQVIKTKDGSGISWKVGDGGIWTFSLFQKCFRKACILEVIR